MENKEDSKYFWYSLYQYQTIEKIFFSWSKIHAILKLNELDKQAVVGSEQSIISKQTSAV